MSTVFEAEQDQPHRIVAVKTVRLGLVSEEAIRRFRYESEVLGRLQHPGIAQVFEAGTWEEPLTKQDVPFFAMELVTGAQTLPGFVHEQRLGVQAAVELFLRVCEAVQHGHQLGFIHRDLKPANVLVDTSGQPKVIDFGIARAADPHANDQSVITQTGQVLGTLQYMAPEQLEGRSDIDTRVDVYALGVMLYELLAGEPPHDPGTLPITKFAQHVKEREPRLPSACGQPLGPFDADLDWIVRTAIAAAREEKYASVSEFARDLERFLANLPVSVGAPSRAYYVKKFVRRNRILVGGVAAVILALTAGIVGISWQMFRVDEERLKAERQVRKAETINRFYNDILNMSNPDEGRDGASQSITVLEALHFAEKKLAQLDEEPDVKADLHIILGSMYRTRVDGDRALQHHRKALEIRREILSHDDPELAEAINQVAISVTFTNESAENVRALYEESLAIYRRAYGDDHEQVAHILVNLGSDSSSSGKFEDALEYFEQALATYRRLPNTLRFQATVLTHKGIAEESAGQGPVAEATFLAALDAYEKAGKADHPYALSTQNQLGQHLSRRAVAAFQAGQRDEAKALMARARERYRVAYEVGRSVHGPDHLRTAHFELEYASALRMSGRFAEAEPRLLHALSIYEKSMSDDHETIRKLLTGLVQLYEQLKQPEKGKPFAARLGK